MASQRTFQLTAHPYVSPTRGSCAYEMGDPTSRNAILFVGGLTDGPHTVGYTRVLAKALESRRDLGYSLFEIRIRSSFIGFGTSSLANDVQDISSLVKYLRSIGRENIILMGHSTGTQDCMEYSNYAKHGNEPVDGFILQAPVSDRESLDDLFPSWPESLKIAEKMIAEGKKDHLMPVDKVPKVFEAPMSAYRFWSLVAPGADDDYFTSDLDDATVKSFWGRFNKPVLILHSEKDEYVPKNVDAAALNKKFQDANPVISKLSGLIPEASHAVKEPDSREWLAQRVQDFLQEISS